MTEEELERRLIKLYYKAAFIGAGVLAVALIVADVLVYKLNPMPEYVTPATIRTTEDLNRDGIKDAYVEGRGGAKVPMFGTKDGTYVSADEFKKLHPNTITDFSVFEEKLNED